MDETVNPQEADDIAQMVTGCRFNQPTICTPVTHPDCWGD